MSLLRQLGVVLWKSLYLQAVRRHYVALLVEPSLVLLVFSFARFDPRPDPGTLIKRVVVPERDAVNRDLLYGVQYVPFVVWGPGNNETYELVRTAFPFAEITLKVDGFVHVGLATQADVRAECARQKKHYSTHGGYVPCVWFNAVANGSLSYLIYTQSTTFSTELRAPSSFNEPPPRFEVDPTEEVMQMIESAFVNLQENTTNFQEPQVFVKRFPHPPLPKEIPLYRKNISYVLALGYLIPFCIRLNTMVQENSAAIKELQLLMGLSDLAYWMGLFCSSMLFLIVDSIIAIGCLTILKDTQTGTHSYFENVNLLLLAVVFLVFCCMQTLHAMLISVLFNGGAMTALFGLLYWLVLTFVGPVFYIEGFTGGLARYILARPWKKLTTSMTPCIGTYWMLKILSLFQDYDGYAGWGMVNEYALDLDNVTIMQILCVMGATFVALVCLIWYLSRVLPWVASAPRPFYFPLLPSYWIPSLVVPMDCEEGGPGREDGVFEPLPKGMKIVMSARDLSKVFGKAVALNRVNLDIYEGQITVLLGHNGSGKTTLMNIFAGLTSPSGGVARICGYDVTKSTAQARQSMGYCQQSNVFFDDLTVREHLIYFGTLKGVGSSELGGMTDKILEEVKLTNKADSFPEVLSGGMKRKLGVAIALVAKPKVLFLDEPSSGMDAQNRRTMWNLLLELRSRCTLLLSTHDMEEADVLADRILVLAKGALVCSGSPHFLMREYGAGYQVRITKKSAGFDLLQIQRIIVATAPEAELVEERAGDVLIRLNVVHFTGFDVMFRALEEMKDQLGIGTIGVTLSTIEDVYIKIHFEAASKTGQNSDIYDDAKVVGKTRHRKPVASASLKALVIKRAIHLSRSWDLCLVSCIMPCLAILAIFIVEDLLLPQPPSEVPGEMTLPVTLDAIKPSGAQVFVLQETAIDQELADMFARLTVTGERATVRNFTDARRGLFMEAAMDFWGYTQTYILGAAFTRDRVELWYSAYTNGSQAVAMNLLTTALLRLRTGNPTADLSATVVIHEQPLDTDRHDVHVASEMIRKSAVFRSFSFPVVTSLIVAGFVLFPVAERTCQAKTLQLMTGMSGSAYWGSNLMFDLVVYWVIWIFAAMVVLQYVQLFIDSILALIVVIGVFSGLALPCAYLLSRRANTQYGAFAIVTITFSFFGTSLLILSGLTGAYERDEQVTLDYVYMMFPPYAFPSCLIKILKLDIENRACLRHRQSIIKAKCKALRNEMWGHMLYCCSTTEEESDYWSPVHPLGFSQRGVGYEVIVMAIEGTLLFLLLSWLDSGSLPISEAYDPDRHKAHESLDRDVMAEKDVVRDIVSKNIFSKAALTVEDLHKKFATLHAVKGLSFTVLSKECFGFLGSNGAGKTTAFQMLAALIPASRGEAYMRRCTLSREARKWQSKVGYCPQYGGLLETLTAREYLRLFASLRGVSTHKIEQLVESVVNLMGLDGIADNRCGTYSGGNKRKLSMAAAIIGLPRLVLLDEPTAGVDVVARRRLLSGLRVVMDYSNMSVVLTSQKMDECETACDRIGILLAGQFRCLGTLQHLKDKYGTGSTIKLKLQSRDAQMPKSVEDAIGAQFPGIQLMDFHQGIFVFRLEEKLPWSVLFSKMLALQSQFVFEYVLVSDTTLEQIFIDLTRTYEREGRGKSTETSS